MIDVDKYFVRPDLDDLFLYSGKNNPELYFRPEVRAGISSFSSLSNAAEVDSGLKMLKSDVVSGKVNEIMKSFENESGDYLFITGRKI